MNAKRVRNWTIAAIIGLTMFYIYGLYEKALFFTPIQLYVMAGVVLFGLVVSVGLGGWQLRMPVWALFVFTYAIYTIGTTLWAANSRTAMEGAVTIGGAALLAVSAAALPHWGKRYMVNMLAAAGPVVYLFGIGVVLKLWNFTSVTENSASGTVELNSVFQYHNTFGSFELMVFVLSVGLAIAAELWWVRALYFMAAAWGVIGVISSYSREVWILLPIGVVLMVLAQLMRKNAVRAIRYNAYAIVVGAAGAVYGLHALSRSILLDAIISVVIVIVGSVVFAMAEVGYVKLVVKNRRLGTIVMWLAVVVVIAVMVYGVHHEAAKLGAITSKVSSIQLKDFSLQQRLVFYQAGLWIWKHNWLSMIFGTGWGTWAAKYLAFQQYPYESTQAHSVVMDNLMNGGLIGFLLWVGTIVFAVMSFIRSIRRNDKQSTISAAVSVGAMVMLLHGFFDFDFSYSLVTATFFLLLGLGALPYVDVEDKLGAIRSSWFNRRESPATTSVPPYKWISYASPTVNTFMAAASVALVILGGMLSAGEFLYHKATTTDASTMTTADSDLQKATQWAPYYADAHSQLAQNSMNEYMQAMQSATSSSSSSAAQQYASTALAEAKRAVEEDPWNAQTMYTMAYIAYQMGQNADAYTWAKRSASDSPYHSQFPGTAMGIAFWTGLTEFTSNKKDATQHFNYILSVYKQAQASVAAQKKMTFGYQPSWTYDITAPMQGFAGAASYALGDYQGSLNTLQNMSKDSYDASTKALVDIVTLLDNERLHPGYTNAATLKAIKANTTYQTEYQVMGSLHPLKKVSGKTTTSPSASK